MNNAPDWQEYVQDAPDYVVPDAWTPEHVLVRMKMAFEALAGLKIKVGPAGYGSGWPTYVHGWDDMMAQESNMPGENNDEAEKRKISERRDASSRAVSPPTKLQYDLMEQAFQWPLRYLGGDDACGVQIVRWAMRRARGQDGDKEVIVGVMNEAGVLAYRLQRDRVVVR